MGSSQAFKVGTGLRGRDVAAWNTCCIPMHLVLTRHIVEMVTTLHVASCRGAMRRKWSQTHAGFTRWAVGHLEGLKTGLKEIEDRLINIIYNDTKTLIVEDKKAMKTEVTLIYLFISFVFNLSNITVFLFRLNCVMYPTLHLLSLIHI